MLLISITSLVSTFASDLANDKVVSNSLGMDGLAFASFEANGRTPPTLMAGKFAYYLASDDKTIPDQVRLQLFTTPAEPELYQTLTDPAKIMNATASAGYITPEFDRYKWPLHEQKRRGRRPQTHPCSRT